MWVTTSVTPMQGDVSCLYSHFQHLDGDRQGPRPAQGAIIFSKAIILKEQRVSPV